jgi:predicted nuclease of predicted toxin-antitoxin system
MLLLDMNIPVPWVGWLAARGVEKRRVRMLPLG